MKKSIVALGAVFAAMSFVSLSPLMAGDQPVKQETPANEAKVIGTIKSVDGKTLTVEIKGGEVKTVVYNDKTEIVKNKVVYAETLKVGDKINARIKDNVAVRIEVRGEKPKKHAEAK